MTIVFQDIFEQELQVGDLVVTILKNQLFTMVEYFKKGNKITCVLKDRDTDEITVGRAKCSPEDTFDENYGRELAFARARYKELKKNEREIRECIDVIQQNAQEVAAHYVSILVRILDRKDEARDKLVELEKRYSH